MSEPERQVGAASIDAPDWRSLAGRLAALGSIAGEAAHRFNNLRSVIDGTLDLMAGDPSGALTERRLQRVRDAAARAQALAAGLAALGRSRAGAEIPLDLADWLVAAKPWMRQLLAPGTELSLAVSDQPATLRADPDALRAAMTALVLNAAAAVGAAGRVSIRLAPTKATHGAALLSVADDGPGMPPEVAARAREPFFTTRPPAAGLGLTVAESFAAHRGGRLEMSSEPGLGTTVFVHLIP
ncbi:MAG TPA: ATP-binding protein [Acetobacteraceae bacterium]|nr:ATP-binding protein [Acetobacteraceae bacterium]